LYPLPRTWSDEGEGGGRSPTRGSAHFTPINHGAPSQQHTCACTRTCIVCVCHKNDVTITAPCANGHVPRMRDCVRCTYVGSCAFHVQHAKRSLATTGSMDTEYTPVLAARTPVSSRGTSLASQPSRPASGPLPGAALHATRDRSSQHHAHVIRVPVP
jgi:hypothetical protein